jgi:hypothetical protein
MRAVLMWTINDFPAYGMLSGWVTHGRLACPHCMEHTKSFTLKMVERLHGLIVIVGSYKEIINFGGKRICLRKKQ